LAFHSWREADHSPPSSAEVKESVELSLHSLNTPSWRGAQLMGAQRQLYLYLYNGLYSCLYVGHISKYFYFSPYRDTKIVVFTGKFSLIIARETTPIYTELG
jgi:hypothetical protein